MSQKVDCHIDIEAARALVHWKALFANEVASRARQLAAESGPLGHVTLAHYRQAAQIALSSLSAAILEGGPSHDDRQAA